MKPTEITLHTNNFGFRVSVARGLFRWSVRPKLLGSSYTPEQAREIADCLNQAADEAESRQRNNKITLKMPREGGQKKGKTP